MQSETAESDTVSGQNGLGDDRRAVDNGSNGLGNHVRGDHRGSSQDSRGKDWTAVVEIDGNAGETTGGGKGDSQDGSEDSL